MIPNPHRKSHGFTLIEMSVVLAIIGIVTISLVEIFSANLQRTQFKQTVAKMETIQKSLYDYRLAFNRLPCPGDARIAINAANFGMEAGSLVNSAWVPTYGDCYSTGTVTATFQKAGGSVSSGDPALDAHLCSVQDSNTLQILIYTGETMPTQGSVIIKRASDPMNDVIVRGILAAGTSLTSNLTNPQVYSDHVIYTATISPPALQIIGGHCYIPVSPASAIPATVEGMVPTKTLQLPDDYAFDGWGRRFMYAVSADITQNGAFSAISVYDNSTRMTINNAQGKLKSPHAAEVLVSFGPNGHGAYPRNGVTARVSAGSTNLNELENCDCGSDASNNAFNGIFVQNDLTLTPATASTPADATNSFDDIVYFTSRGSYILPSSFMQGSGSSGSGSSGSGSSGSGSSGGTQCYNTKFNTCQ